jgi:Zn-dependent protease with chaperone function
MKSLRAAVLLALPAFLSACATPALQSPTTDPAAVAREAAMQRKFVIDRIKAQQERVSRVMFRISVGAADICGNHVTGAFGLAGMTAKQFPGQYEAIARQEFGFDDGLTVTAVFPGSPAETAGLLPGDRIVSFGNNAAGSSQALQNYLLTSAQNNHAVPIQYRRHGETLTALATPLPACNYPANIKEDPEINAYADGQQVVFNTGLLNFYTSDEEFAVVASHELSHNTLDHLGKKKENALVGGALGLAADILIIATTGINPGLYRTGEQLGAQAYSVEFEKEADYQGLYLMRRAGYPIANAANVWRRLAAENPSSITISRTHPSTPERFLAMSTAIAEIESKESQHIALLPNLKDGTTASAVGVASAGGNSQPAAALQPALARALAGSAMPKPIALQGNNSGSGVALAKSSPASDADPAGSGQLKSITIATEPPAADPVRTVPAKAAPTAVSTKATPRRPLSATASALSAAPVKATVIKPAPVLAANGTSSPTIPAACTHQQQVDARIAKMNGYTGGPKCD